MAGDAQLAAWVKLKLQITPNDINKYQMALTTRQYEVLEFLGDALLSLVVADFLVRSNPAQEPGFLTNARSCYVCKDSLAKVGRELAIPTVANLPNTCDSSQLTDKVLEDMVEALLGAVYLDLGMEEATRVIFHLFQLSPPQSGTPATNPWSSLRQELEKLPEPLPNPTSDLQTCLQRHGFSPPHYTDGSPTHAEASFFVQASCHLGDTTISADGRGSSKRAARAAAACNLLRQLTIFLERL